MLFPLALVRSGGRVPRSKAAKAAPTGTLSKYCYSYCYRRLSATNVTDIHIFKYSLY